jgi:hypothetical protein
VSLRIPSSSRSLDHDPHHTIYYLGCPLGRFAGLKHRQLARQVGVIITTGRIRRTLINKINLLVDYAAHTGASARHEARHAARRATCRRLLHLVQAHRRLLCLCRASGCLGTSRGSSCGSSRRSLSTTLPTPRVRVPRHVARLVMRLVALLVVDYFDYAARPGASARRATRHVACRAARHAARRAAPRRLLRLAQARRRPLRLRRASRCLGSSCGSSSTTPPRAGSSSTTSPPPRV